MVVVTILCVWVCMLMYVLYSRVFVGLHFPTVFLLNEHDVVGLNNYSGKKAETEREKKKEPKRSTARVKGTHRSPFCAPSQLDESGHCPSAINMQMEKMALECGSSSLKCIH